MYLPPRAVRRSVLAPVAFVGATVLVIASPVLHLILLVLDLVFDRRRWRFTRFGGLGLAFCVVEAFGLFALFTTWLGSGFGAFGRRPFWVRANTVLVRQWLGMITRALRFYLGFEFTCTQERELPDGPLLVLGRHAGPGDALLIARIMVRDHRRRLRMLGTAKLQWDPFFDIIGDRLGFHYAGLAQHDRLSDLEAITRMAAELGPGEVLIIFPEGGNFTRRRRRNQLGAFVDRRMDEELERASALRHTLLPKPGGVCAALDGGLDDVVFVAHAGLEDLFGLRDLWAAVPLRHQVRAHVWPARTEPPQEPDARTRWLHDEWAHVDRWIHDTLPEIMTPSS